MIVLTLGLVFGFESPLYNFSESVGTGFLGVHLSPESVRLTENLVFTFSTANGLGENAAAVSECI